MVLGAQTTIPEVVRFSSRNTAVTEGETSNYLSNLSFSMASSWGYGGSNSDAIWITTSGATAKLAGFTIANYITATNNFTFDLYVISGNSTNGTVLASRSFSNVSLNTDAGGQTMFEFTAPVTLVPGNYTLAFAWPVFLSARTYYQTGSYNRTSSTITGSGKTLTINYWPGGVDVTFNGPDPLDASNGTSSSGFGQVITLKWLL